MIGSVSIKPSVSARKGSHRTLVDNAAYNYEYEELYSSQPSSKDEILDDDYGDYEGTKSLLQESRTYEDEDED